MRCRTNRPPALDPSPHTAGAPPRRSRHSRKGLPSAESGWRHVRQASSSSSSASSSSTSSVVACFWLAPTSLVVPTLQALHVYLSWPCWQMALPPQYLHSRLCLPCWQMPLHPQSLHSAFCRPCWQMPLPPQPLHWGCLRPCWQMPLPPQSGHSLCRSWHVQLLRHDCVWVIRSILHAHRDELVLVVGRVSRGNKWGAQRLHRTSVMLPIQPSARSSRPLFRALLLEQMDGFAPVRSPQRPVGLSWVAVHVKVEAKLKAGRGAP